MNSAPSPKVILILAANPQGTVSLRLDEEVREIKAGFQRSRYRDQFAIDYQLASRPKDVQRAMLTLKPQIVHFCGHGEGEAGLVLEDNAGRAKRVSTKALADLFRLFDGVECVLLNACYSEVQAKAIAQHIPYVIGMNQAIGDRAAIEFATSFYEGLGAGGSVEFAFDLGRNAMQLEGIPEEQTPVLIRVEGAVVSPAPEIASPEPSPKLMPVEPPPTGSRVFISYKRSMEPDEQVALAIYQALAQTHCVFIDQTMTVGTRWAEQIEAEIRRSDFLIILLSVHSVQSEMVIGEIETAHHQFKDQ
jgi:hypothetical protein